MMRTTLTRADFDRAARTLKCEPEAVMAVAKVESGKAGAFDDDGFPTILFERHLFYHELPKESRASFARAHPDICNVNPGGYGTSAGQRARFTRAFAIDAEAAMKACSWGAFQELGRNYSDYGFKSVGEFVDAMKSGIDAQFDIFIKSIIKRRLADELQRHDWKGFARNYNGPTYYLKRYDEKMAEAYKLAKAQYPRLKAAPDPEPVTEPVAEPQPEPKESAPQTDVKVIEAPAKEGTTATATQLTIAGFTVPTFLVGIVTAIQSAIANGFISAAQVGEAVIGFVRENTKWALLLVGLVIVGMMLKKKWKQDTFNLQMQINADPNLHDVEVKKQ